MIKLELFYRDGANYKDSWDVEIADELWQRTLKHYGGLEKVLNTDGFDDKVIEIDYLGFSAHDIPMIAEYGFNDMYDHNLVAVMGVEKI